MKTARTNELWLPADLAVLLLHQEATRIGDQRLRIKQPTLRQWARRGYTAYERGRGYNITRIFNHLGVRGTHGQHRST